MRAPRGHTTEIRSSCLQMTKRISIQKPLQATYKMDKPHITFPRINMTSSTILFPGVLATTENYEFKKQLPKLLRKVIHFSVVNTWWVDGREIPDGLSIPIQVAQRAVIVRGWLLSFNFNVLDDPLPGCRVAELLEGSHADKVLYTYGKSYGT
ncbi:uncharacterized protein DFL_006385 [Arthrobotrys flagrans]|uniref:Uncharacterized protein n=1 Tax=Arthrobotrys flagrans TaxID=97331 RepID=A0A437A087_ARTFL|nr:hypothetical protein DFL_006385 [Arthrobotrys flagrans]